MFHYLKKIFSTKKHFNYLDNFWSFDNNNYSVNASSYRSNVIVNRCVNIVAQSAGHVPWLVMQRSKHGLQKVATHQLNHLLKRPNPTTGGAEFFCQLISNKLLYGNSYILGINAHKHLAPSELYCLNPSGVEIITNKNGTKAYKYSCQSGDKFYPIDKLTEQSNVLHIKSYNPDNSSYGLSCLEAAGKLINLHDRATQWNHTLLKNGARPSGALIVGGGNYLSQEQFERLKAELNEKYYGSNNAGKPMLLEGGMEWKEMSISPKDMDFIESKNCAAREIALAFGVPPQLLGINGDNTYSNMQEARLALWEETLIPLLDKIADSLSNWMSNWFNQDLVIDFDRDSISILTERREKLWMTLTNVNFMTINEKRATVGMAPIADGNNL